MTDSSKTLHLFGIKACDTMKKARTWLDEHGVPYDFHDYKSSGIDRDHLNQWCNEHGWQVVLWVSFAPLVLGVIALSLAARRPAKSPTGSSAVRKHRNSREA